MDSVEVAAAFFCVSKTICHTYELPPGRAALPKPPGDATKDVRSKADYQGGKSERGRPTSLLGRCCKCPPPLAACANWHHAFIFIHPFIISITYPVWSLTDMGRTGNLPKTPAEQGSEKEPSCCETITSPYLHILFRIQTAFKANLFQKSTNTNPYRSLHLLGTFFTLVSSTLSRDLLISFPPSHTPGICS